MRSLKLYSHEEFDQEFQKRTIKAYADRELDKENTENSNFNLAKKLQTFPRVFGGEYGEFFHMVRAIHAIGNAIVINGGGEELVNEVIYFHISFYANAYGTDNLGVDFYSRDNEGNIVKTRHTQGSFPQVIFGGEEHWNYALLIKGPTKVGWRTHDWTPWHPAGHIGFYMTNDLDSII